MRAKRQPPLETVHRLEDIPRFASGAEEHAFWATHELDEALWDQAEPFGPDELPPPRPATKPVAIRFDEHTLARLKRLARKRHKGYQTLLKEFVIERLYEEEKREGLHGTSGSSSARQAWHALCSAAVSAHGLCVTCSRRWPL